MVLIRWLSVHLGGYYRGIPIVLGRHPWDGRSRFQRLLEATKGISRVAVGILKVTAGVSKVIKCLSRAAEGFSKGAEGIDSGR